MSPNLIKVTFRLKVAEVDLNLKIIPTSKIWLCGFQPVIWKILFFDFLILRSAFAAIFQNKFITCLQRNFSKRGK